MHVLRNYKNQSQAFSQPFLPPSNAVGNSSVQEELDQTLYLNKKGKKKGRNFRLWTENKNEASASMCNSVTCWRQGTLHVKASKYLSLCRLCWVSYQTSNKTTSSFPTTGLLL